MVNQMVPAAPSVPWTDPCSAEALQPAVGGRSPDGPRFEGGVSGPGPGWGGLVGRGLRCGAVVGGWGAADGGVAVEWALQPVVATAVARRTAAMTLAGRMASSPRSSTTL